MCTALSIARLLSPSESVAWRGDGLPLDLFWLLTLLGWATAAWHDRQVFVRTGWIDAGMLLLVAWSVIAAGHAAVVDASRPAINMLWSWLAVGAAFWLWRQLVADDREARTVVAVMLAIAVGISGYALYQYFVSLPADRAMYLDDPDAALAAEGLDFPPGSTERELFEQRLFSTEPPGTFALANSLAGWLVPWLLVAPAIGWLSWREFYRGNATILVRVLAGAAAIALVGGFALVLTKSRSAMAGVVVGGGLVLVALARRGTINPKRAAAIAATISAAIALMVAVGVLVGGLDREVLSEAPKSLGFRWQYWQATIQMVREHPWLGCGPGNFGDHYTRFKLPTASEEINDPHNLILEVAATAGLPGALALIVVLVGATWLCFRRTSIGFETSMEPTSCATASSSSSAVSNLALLSKPAVVPRQGFETALLQVTTGQRSILIGAAAGLVLAWLGPRLTGGLIDIAPSLSTTMGFAAVGAVVVWLLWPWVERGRLPTSILAAAALALAFNLLAAGGIAFPAVAGSLWLLIALALNVAPEHAPEQSAAANAAQFSLGRAALSVIGIAALGSAVGCYWTGYQPVVLSMIQSSAARASTGVEAERRLEAAAASDPYAAQPQLDLAQWHFERWLHDQRPESLALFEAAQAKAIELRPHQSAVWLRVGQWYRQIGARTNRPEHFARAVEACRRAVELYPNHARERAVLALAYKAAGRSDEARRAAAAAWEFDRLTPHADQRLHPSLRDELTAAGLGPATTASSTSAPEQRPDSAARRLPSAAD
ncbi:MAG: O-antigen ligase family protein [Pirellulales bacterium]|nr:O-antigen ligase family protein [Pirellulales bacterium]